MLALTRLLRDSGEQWKEIITAPPYCLNVKEKGNLVCFKYSQIFSDPSLQETKEARGIIYDKRGWLVVAYPFFRFFNYGEPNAAITGDAVVYGNARIYENARVFGNAQVYDYAEICGHAEIKKNAIICDYAQVMGRSIIMNAEIKEQWKIDNAVVDHCVNNLEELIRIQTGLIPVCGKVIAYKQVNKDLTSFYDPYFRYVIGKYAEACNPKISKDSCASGLHFSNANYWNCHDLPSDSVFLVAEINLEDIITVQRGKIRCKRALILEKYEVN